tara:strand:- start:635 stop:1927 length:1293 start_codon:yes stop_codon:yes gene_type:complete
MHRYEFKPDDLFVSRIKTYPEYNIFVYQGEMFVNKDTRPAGTGGMVVFDINRNRPSSNNRVYPFIESSSKREAFKEQVYNPLVANVSSDLYNIRAYSNHVSGSSFLSTYPQTSGTILQSTYPFESPIKRNKTLKDSAYTMSYFNILGGFVRNNQNVGLIRNLNTSSSALQNVARKYTTLSDHFIFLSSSIRSRDLVYGTAADNINFITIPNMYYGSTIKKGSVELNYYITGSKIASCADINHNGTLIGTTGSTLGSVVGIVLYDEGIIMLTSSNAVTTTDHHGIRYDGTNPITSSWQYYGTTLGDGIAHTSLASASYDLNFKGTNYVNSMTMFAQARKGHLNHSNNPTYKDQSFNPTMTIGAGKIFSEGDSTLVNVVSASYVSASFEKTTYISKVHVYDEDGNLIAITSMAKPVKKTINDEFTFKMKLDL